MVGIGDGGQRAVTIVDLYGIGGASKRQDTVVGDGHGLRGLGAHHQGWIAIQDPGLVATYCLLCRRAVVVEDAEKTVHCRTTERAFDVVALQLTEDVDKLVLRPHGRNPRL